jgi:hypothetical protein
MILGTRQASAGHHLYGCLGRGSQLLGNIAPGLLDEVAADEAVILDNFDVIERWHTKRQVDPDDRPDHHSR